MSWRRARAKVALAGKEHKTMVKFLNPSIAGRPAPGRVQSTSSCKVPSTITRIGGDLPRFAFTGH